MRSRGHGIFALGVKEQIVFREIDYDKTHAVRVMGGIFITATKTAAD